MDDLTAWLRQQLDDDEQVAISASHARHFYDCLGDCFDHHERWDDARVLAEVDAKRRVIAVCEADLGQRGTGAVDGEVDRPTWDVLAALALPYADRPGYRDEWRP
ncbi:DUF6221 family protein [Micromonospora tulbaghiae]|uniref:DUF6221 family protein n=1 Tax=Micromonospora tulbaghiae TaxID=479978 RepID=UPI0033C1BFD9